MVGLIFPHLHHQHDHFSIFPDHAINDTTAATQVQDHPSREIHLWQNPPQNHTNYLKKALEGGGDGNIVNSGSATARSCRDCGNQAKKECSHRRCRSCCKSRGFECSTHVKSTWVSATRRRERQIAAATAADGPSVLNSTAKKARMVSLPATTFSHMSNSNNNATTRSLETSSSQQDASFRDSLPRHVQAPAVFKCVRVTAVNNGEDEYAYQAMVKIRGHVFKGFLYDQGVQRKIGIPDISHLHLGGHGSSSSPLLDHPDIYAASGSGSIVGMTYGNAID